MRYPAWKYLLILVVLVISTLYALPSLYPDEPAVQISGAKAGTQIDQSVVKKAEQILKTANIASHDNTFTNNAALLRVSSSEAQLKAKEVLRRDLGDEYVVALNLAPTTPEWLQKIGAKPMKLGLDLRGGVHFLLEVDMDKAVAQRMETSATDLRRQFRENKIKFNSLALTNNVITVQFADNAEKAGSKVHFAFDDKEATQIALDILRQREAKMIVKSKTILTEEIGLNEVLEEAGIEVNETDLAEFILQTAVSPPSHIVVPGLHFERNKIREIFAEKLGYTGTENPTEMTHFVRGYVRERFLKADVGVNGCNFAVAESGTCTIVSNEGNGRMASSIPKTQLIFLGTERIVPDFKALDVMMEMLNRSAVGSKISNYFSMMTGPARSGEADGPEETHIIIIDNGRSGILGGTFQEMLRCIRCGACMNICPVYRHVSGHGYGSVYPGPMGAVLTPLFKGYDVAGDLPYASTLCGACTENCPVAIPLHELLMEHRHIMADIEKTRPKAEEAIFTAAAKMFGNATLFDLGTKAGAIGMNLISNKEGNMPEWTQAIPVMNGWTKSKELGSLKFKKFRDLYAEHEKNKKKEKK